jgi:hypothetical protein
MPASTPTTISRVRDIAEWVSTRAFSVVTGVPNIRASGELWAAPAATYRPQTGLLRI